MQPMPGERGSTPHDRGTRGARGHVSGQAPPGPFCRLVIDLRRLPPLSDPEALAALLRTAPGVVRVRVDTRRHRAVVLHDARTSLPRLWNWLRVQASRGAADPPGTVLRGAPADEDQINIAPGKTP